MSLDAGWAGVLGALIGGSTTLVGIWLAHHLQNSRANSIADKRRERLLRELNDKKYTWRSIGRLSAVIGADESTTAELLIEIGARASLTSSKVWALESKAPFPDENALKGQ